MNRLTYILLAILILTALACTYTESSEYANISPDGWIYGDTLYYDCSGPDVADVDSATLRTGDVSLVVRHNNHYEYSNLWIEIQYLGTDSVITDTINYELADIYGKWLGKGIGVSFQQSQDILKGVTLDTHMPIKVSHIMRVDTLHDIEQVGVVFKPTK